MLTKAVPGAPGMVISTFAVGTLVGGGLVRSFGVDTQELVCRSSDGVDQLALALLSGNECATWNAIHPDFVPNQDQYPQFTTPQAVCDAPPASRCFSLIGTYTAVSNGVTSTTACFLTTNNYAGWSGLFGPLPQPGMYDYFASGTLSAVGTKTQPAPTACRNMGANYYISPSSIWDEPGFIFAFYVGRYDASVKPGSTSSELTRTYPDPDRVFKCEVTASNGQTYSANSQTFLESGALLPEIVCPDLPPGVFPVWKTITEEGGDRTLVVADQPTTQEYQDWAEDFGPCAFQGCPLELYKNGVSCWILLDDCDGWVGDSARDSTYTCMYSAVVAPIEECFIYGTTFNQAARDSGHAYADPATGLPVGAQTSPTLEDQIVESLMGRDKARTAWVALPEPERREIARAVAQQCVLTVDDPDDCADGAVYAPGVEIDVVALHNQEAILSGQPSLLTYLSSADKLADIAPLKRQWYTTVQGPCFNTTALSGESCDEYPFFSSEESVKIGTDASGQPVALSSLKYLDASKNSAEGGYRSGFYALCQFSTFQRNSPERQFVVVPTVTLPTAYWCAEESQG